MASPVYAAMLDLVGLGWVYLGLLDLVGIVWVCLDLVGDISDIWDKGFLVGFGLRCFWLVLVGLFGFVCLGFVGVCGCKGFLELVQGFFGDCLGLLGVGGDC